MKRLLCVLLSISLILTSCVFVYAKGAPAPKKGGPKNGHNKPDVTVQVNQFNQFDRDEKGLKDQIKKANKNLEEMKRLLKKMQDLRKKFNKNHTMIVIDGDEINVDVAPVMKCGRTLVPVRAIMDGLKADVKYDAATGTVTVTKAVYSEVYGLQNNVIEIKLGSDMIKINGTEIKNDAPAELIGNRTMVPIRLIAQLLKLKVDWDPYSGAVIIQKTETYVLLPNTPAPVHTATPTPTAIAPTATQHVTTPPPTATYTPTTVSTATSVPATATPVPTAVPTVTQIPTAAPTATSLPSPT